ncbi:MULTISPECIES: hypothetical protein [Rhizobium]|uniref:Uncharacterized protein n=1 Tax=Rhizobium favelukesii TaxID=348824 RepID=W6R5S8_9HYPH|nr:MULTISPECIES: hypothetical protein [Rhizobium]MCS0462925.1 hypothetical protein [Rhizobium favelukesii]UFS82013.1 hypothetical protein LPB79_27650 [Rhizobium sp. T136]CDM56309.1 hypothetical protein LPU83_0627 [Rhizobium favelukesii]
MRTPQYQPKYLWKPTWTGETGLDGKPLQDFQAWDGEVPVGRIRYEDGGPKREKWQWSGHGPEVRERLMPHQGFEPTAREASRMAEEYYDRLMAANGLKGKE